MEKLTIKLIKNNQNQLEYSVLEQSEKIKGGYFDHTIFFGEDRFFIFSAGMPQLIVLPPYAFFIRGLSKEHDDYVDIITINEGVNKFLKIITCLNMKKLRQELAKENIDFRLVTNLYIHNVNSKF
jgi:hypothetical protein